MGRIRYDLFFLVDHFDFSNCQTCTQNTQPMREDRLLILAAHLEFGKLGHKKFDFRVYNQNIKWEPVKLGECGTRGCALGECPIVWPEYWKFSLSPSLIGIKMDMDDVRVSITSAAIFFDITSYEVEFLFFPDRNFHLDKKRRLNSPKGSATRYDVAEHIKRFVKLKLNEA